jgi:hypothetical protein
MRKLMAALAVGMAVTGGSVASAQDPEDGLTVTLHVTNRAAISPKDLAAAEAYATAIYRAAVSRRCGPIPRGHPVRLVRRTFAS